jgi:hypothetical protein
MDITRYSNFNWRSDPEGSYWAYDTNVQTINSDIPITISSSVSTTSLFTSDSRIKKDIVEVDTNICLSKIDNIKVYSYNYICNEQSGGSDVIGFVAQQVKEIEPNCVSHIDEYIPNINRFCRIYDLNSDTSGGFYYDSSQNICYKKRIPIENKKEYLYKLDISGLEINIEDQVRITLDQPVNATVKEVHSNYIVISVNEYFDPLSSVINNYKPGNYTDENGITAKMKIDPDRLYYNSYIYGKRVNDFNVLDKNRLYAIAVGAIQELSKQVQALQTTNLSLEQRLTSSENLISQILQKYPI